MAKAKIVTAYVPLAVRHLTKNDYYDYAQRMADAVGLENIRIFWDYPYHECWAHKAGFDFLPPATPTPADRYASPETHAKSNVVQHQRTTWARMAAVESPEVDTWIWLDCGILKQGDFTGKRITEEHIQTFFQQVGSRSLTNIPFPGIAPVGDVDPAGNNWRFCGSTHIWPTKYLDAIDETYKTELILWTNKYKTVPLDLPIWALTEQAGVPDLPFTQYPAEYDYTQLTNYPRE